MLAARRCPVLTAGALATTLWLSAGAAGCQDEGQRFECRCGFLTDYDDSSVQAVEVCAANAGDAPAVARGCAQSAAPAPIQSCECGASKNAAKCVVGKCEVNAEKP